MTANQTLPGHLFERWRITALSQRMFVIAATISSCCQSQHLALGKEGELKDTSQEVGLRARFQDPISGPERELSPNE